MDSHQQQQEPPRATAGVEDKVSGLLLRQAIFDKPSPDRGRSLFETTEKVAASKIWWGRLLRLALLLGDNA